jgi:hypothetical protein
MSLTRVFDKSVLEINNITKMFMGRISSLKGKYKDSLTQLKLADFWYKVKYYKNVLKLLEATIELKEY